MTTLHLDNWTVQAKALPRGSKRNADKVKGVTIHFSTGSGSDAGTPEGVVRALKGHGSYNFLVGRRPPLVYMLIDPNIVAAHAGGKVKATGPGSDFPKARPPKPHQVADGKRYTRTPNGMSPNTNTIGVSFVAEYGFNKSGSRAKRDPHAVQSAWPHPKLGGPGWWEGFPPDQLEAGARLVAWLLIKYGMGNAPIDSVVFPHGEHPEATGIANWKPDPGPGFPWSVFLRKVDQYRKGGVTAKFDKGGLLNPRILPRPN